MFKYVFNDIFCSIKRDLYGLIDDEAINIPVCTRVLNSCSFWERAKGWRNKESLMSDLRWNNGKFWPKIGFFQLKLSLKVSEQASLAPKQFPYAQGISPLSSITQLRQKRFRRNLKQLKAAEPSSVLSVFSYFCFLGKRFYLS